MTCCSPGASGILKEGRKTIELTQKELVECAVALLIWLAIGLLKNTFVLLIDEPTVGLSGR